MTNTRDRDARTLEVFELHAPRVLASASRNDSAHGRASARLMLATLKRLRASVATPTCGAFFGDATGAACSCTLDADHPGAHFDAVAAS